MSGSSRRGIGAVDLLLDGFAAYLRSEERAIARVTPPDTAPGRYQPPDPLLAFLDSL
jgi:hypothetical protein